MKRIACTAVILHRDGKLLLQGRAGISKHGEEWAFFGGKLEEGETPIECAVREIKEELDLAIDPPKPAGIFIETYEEYEITVHAFVTELPIDAHPRLLEGSAMEWVTPDEARKRKMFKSDDKIIQAYEDSNR